MDLSDWISLNQKGDMKEMILSDDPYEYVVVDTKGVRGLRDFAGLYADKPDRYGRQFVNTSFESICEMMVRVDGVLSLDEVLFEEIINYSLKCKLDFMMNSMS